MTIPEAHMVCLEAAGAGIVQYECILYNRLKLVYGSIRRSTTKGTVEFLIRPGNLLVVESCNLGKLVETLHRSPV